MKRLFKSLALVAGALTALVLAGSSAAAGVSGPAFYINGTAYRTVGTPTDFSGTDAPASTYDVIYDLGGAQLNVAEAAPGDHGFNGGRWEVHQIVFNNDYASTLAVHDLDGDGVFDHAAEIQSALGDASGTGATDLGIVRRFECPVIPLRKK